MPIPISFEDATLQGNEAFKSFDGTDSLGKSYLDLHGKVTAGSIDLLPEEMRKDPAISVFKTLPELARGYVETKKMVGSIEKPPEKPEAYKFTTLSNLHPKLKADVIQGQIKGIAHKAGLGNKAADMVQQEILGVLSANILKQEQDRKTALESNETALRSEWGADYDAKLDKIVNIFTKIGGPEMAKETDAISAALKGSPNFLKGMGKLVGFLSEDSINSLGEDGQKQITDSKEAVDEIVKLNAEIVKDGIKHPYYDDKHPKHLEFKKRMDDLFLIAYPNK